MKSICEICNDSHTMDLRGQVVMCTHCPVPCESCRQHAPDMGPGAFCATTPCSCACHANDWRYRRVHGLGWPTSGPPPLVTSLAIEVANKGPCAKSKRGVVIFTRHDPERLDIHAQEFNSPPWPFECSKTDACKADCGRICVHAEQRAIVLSAGPGPRVLHRLTIAPDNDNPAYYGAMQLVHVKTVDGKLVPSPKGPSCDQCSKLILEAGVTLVWLYTDHGVWTCYEATDFHSTTLRNCGLHSHI